MKKILRIVFHRVFLVVVFMLLQLLLLVGMIYRFNEYFTYFYAICVVLSLVAVLGLVNNKSNPAYQIVWIIVIMVFPLFGIMFYGVFGRSQLSRREKKSMFGMNRNLAKALVQSKDVSDRLREESVTASNQSKYITNYALCPVYDQSTAEYFPTGEANYRRMLEELKKAKHYIFLEYFIIDKGEVWNTVLDILCEKVREGLDVRVIYDDMGCVMTLPTHYKRTLESMGIQCVVFNKLRPELSPRFNHRDHRKICVIDGHTGFTGGVNLADEYINAFPKYGYWKDTAVMIKGDAVWNLTVMFLSLWDYCKGIEEDYDFYRPEVHQNEKIVGDGYIQPYTDNPLDHEPVGQTVYLNLINHAKKYVYITTPYLILDHETLTALSVAAKSGVDVRIITPHIPDKWFVHAVTRAYYETLIENGVRIYEFLPGFIHAKNFIVDDEYGVVGTINLDYRSLYLHFECATWFYRSSCIEKMKEDYKETLAKSKAITLEECKNLPWYRKFGRAVLKLFAPMM